ncbi:MAG: RNA 2',3'-cyclic phosphodiesterase [Candidatus Moranbacteria bacterium]|nr:RNA 2',3'-cyclic phosphodiesterase [Candidatus Moranbacteria bacterium]
MQRRIFVGISIPDDIKKRIFHFVEKELKKLPVAWSRKENYHITLNFLGFTLEEKIPELRDAIREATSKQKSFELEFFCVEAGPSEKSKRLMWITGKEDQELNTLKSRLDKSLGEVYKKRRKYIPHITLGRIKKGSRDVIQQDFELKREINFSVPVLSVELFESKYEKGKRIYYVLESFPLAF